MVNIVGGGKETDDMAVKHLLLLQNLGQTEDFSQLQSKPLEIMISKLNIFFKGVNLRHIRILLSVIQKQVQAGVLRR